MYISFGDRITLLRKKKKLTQEQLAVQVGISTKELSGYEGDAASPPLNVAIQPSLQLLKWSAEIDGCYLMVILVNSSPLYSNFSL